MTHNTPVRETPDVAPAAERQQQLFRTIARVGATTTAVALAFTFLLELLVPQYPIEYIIPILLVFTGLLLFSLWVNRRGRFDWAVAIYITGATVFVFTLMHLVGGVSGPMAIGLIEIPVVASVLGGRRASRITVVGIAALYVVMALLETVGAVHPLQLLGPDLRFLYVGMALLTLSVTALFVGRSSDQMEAAVSVAQQRSLELVAETQRAEQAAQEARQGRAREEQAARNLRQTVQEYAVFLERVTAGDYEARLDLERVPQEDLGGTVLLRLGHQINVTVESVAAAVREMQAAQRQYVAETWKRFTASRPTQTGFQYRDGETRPAADTWLGTMTDTVRQARVVAQDDELSIPMTLRGEVIGAVGIRRREADGWNEDELALAQAVVDQLTQTIETLRLIEDTQRRAVHQQAVGQMTAHFTRSLDMDGLLQTAVQELGRLLAVDEVSVYVGALEPPAQEEEEVLS
ncbi:MAG: hypothetical protein JXD18_07470 [Anaerolineae bacterium]|nr:hypothetical protein [Anaerolineae bacterium]